MTAKIRLIAVMVTATLGFSAAPPIALADVALSQSPLAKASKQSVAPNLLYILDDSRSMAFQYTPDYVSTDYKGSGGEPDGVNLPLFYTTAGGNRGGISCRGSSDGSLSTPETCLVGDPPYMAGQFNSQYYNPRIRYLPGVKADGTSYPSMNATNTTNWTKVPLDGYRIQEINQLWVKTLTTATLDGTTFYTEDLTKNIPDRLWCNSKTTATAVSSTCKINSSYAYPNASNGYGRTSGYDSMPNYASGAPYYYNIAPIYCTDTEATSCSKTKTGSYQTEVAFRWCKSGGWTDSNCQARRSGSYTLPSFLEPETATKAVGSFRVTSGSKNKTLTVTVIYGSTTDNLLLNWGSGSSNITTPVMASNVVSAINSNTSSAYSAACKVTNCTDSVITITAKTSGSTYNGTLSTSGNLNTDSLSNAIGGADAPKFFTRVNITPGNTYLVDGGVPTGRTDCTSTGCTYDQEMENYANWYAYYRTRLQAMKSSTTQAFAGVGDSFRVGFATIKEIEDGIYDVPIDAFDSTQKTKWFKSLLDSNIASDGGTPLRISLNFAGRLFAGKTNFIDPMQYSCQQNFTLLTTDGYWNDNVTPTKLDSGNIDDQDGVTGVSRPYYEPNSTKNTLADIAMYYYNTDLRDSALGNCASGSGTGADVCENNVPVSNDDPNKQQHMITYGLGLGVDGTLKYRSDYRTATTGDYYSIKNNGGLNWPNPTTNDAKVDDLWHAAVNGRGVYYSARNPESLISGLKSALGSMTAAFGIGASAATSTSEPVSGDNYAYVATYTTSKWTGNVEARLIDIKTGAVGKQAQWCAEDVAADATNNTTACTGTMAAKVGSATDSRTIYFNSGGALTSFTKNNLSSAQRAYFDTSKLNQYSSWSTAYKTEAAKNDNENLINYLRGQTGNDTRDTNTYRLFRQRETTLGDFVDSAPKYVKKASASYSDAGYSDFSSNTVAKGGVYDRTPVIYVGGNDGMLHAFNATTGSEMWAFVPTPALSEMWRLASDDYSNNHRFYVDGTVTVGDVCTANCTNAKTATWKTVLVAALGAGVKQSSDGTPNSGYFALDVTDPASPVLLWEKTSKDATVGQAIGFTLGKPWLAKVSDSSNNTVWAALLSSGINPADANGQLIVVNAYTGTLIRSIDLPDAIGFSRFSPQFADPGVDQTAIKVYGGDLSGNVWRIDPNKASDVTKIFSGAHAFTTAPELSVCNENTVVYIGSGKLLETDDLTNKDQQSFYGFVDDGIAVTAPKSELQKLTISGSTISGSSNSDSASKKGWYLDFPGMPDDGGSERVALVDPKLDSNLLTFVTNTPKNGICYASGESHLYKLSMSACSLSTTFPKVTEGGTSFIGNFLTVGMTQIKLSDGSIKVILTGSEGSIITQQGGSTTSGSFNSKRVSWRELINE